ncbi:MAG: radical SAM family heme chaperone HemW [Trueperaceae bacterium]
MVRSLYMHVPFCPSVCPYCDFHKMRRHEGLVARYLDRLEAEAAELATRHPGPLDTVYLGGGTPSHLTDGELTRVFALLGRHWGTPARLETTLEADPRTFDPERLARFRDLGVDRLSIGLQSTQDDVLRFLGRVHDGTEGLTAVTQALDAGFRVNVDVIMAVPGQDLERDLRRVADLGVRHMSVYTLTVEPHTPFALRGVRVDPDVDADAFETAERVLASYRLERYEVSNYAVPGEESRHNQAYWRGAWYLGLGPSASSHMPHGPFGTRYRNPPIRGWLAGAAPERDPLSAGDVVLERLMTGLRTRDGVDLAELETRTGVHVETIHAPWLRTALRHDLVTLDEVRRLRATGAGLARLDALLLTFVREGGSGSPAPAAPAPT